MFTLVVDWRASDGCFSLKHPTAQTQLQMPAALERQNCFLAIPFSQVKVYRPINAFPCVQMIEVFLTWWFRCSKSNGFGLGLECTNYVWFSEIMGHPYKKTFIWIKPPSSQLHVSHFHLIGMINLLDLLSLSLSLWFFFFFFSAVNLGSDGKLRGGFEGIQNLSYLPF